jgi:hypothetical protein
MVSKELAEKFLPMKTVIPDICFLTLFSITGKPVRFPVTPFNLGKPEFYFLRSIICRFFPFNMQRNFFIKSNISVFQNLRINRNEILNTNKNFRCNFYWREENSKENFSSELSLR